VDSNLFSFSIFFQIFGEFFPLPCHHALDIIDIQYLTFDCNGQHIWAKHLNHLIGVVSFVIIQVHTQVMEILKNKVKVVIEFFILELQALALLHLMLWKLWGWFSFNI
jgi:hypothetical protein